MYTLYLVAIWHKLHEYLGVDKVLRRQLLKSVMVNFHSETSGKVQRILETIFSLYGIFWCPLGLNPCLKIVTVKWPKQIWQSLSAITHTAGITQWEV